MYILQVKRASKWVWIILATTLLFVVLGSMGRAMADDGTANNQQRMITIYDRGVEHAIITRATTVRAALTQANITIDKVDMVEPGLDSQLVADHYNINVYRARPVIVEDGQTRIRTITAAQSPTKIARTADITLYPEDDTVIKRIDDVVADGGAGLKLTIDRATPFTFVLYGKKLENTRTQATTVSDMLKEKGVTLGPNDGVSVPLETGIVSGMSISVWRNGVQTVTQEEAIAMPVEQVKDQDREVGYKQVKTVGKPGKKQVTYEINMQNGVEVSRRVIQEVQTLAPVKQIEAVGVKRPPVAGPAEILAKINAASAAKGIDANRVAGIAKCESGFNPMADSGYYKGLFQHDPNYWPARAAKYGFAGASIFDVDAQIGVSTSMMAGGGWSHWGCDRG